MVEILEQPKPFVKICTKCGCKFQYEYTDLEKHLLPVQRIKCPVCGELLNHHVEKDEHHFLNQDLGQLPGTPYIPQQGNFMWNPYTVSPIDTASYNPYYDKVTYKNEVAQ